MLKSLVAVLPAGLCKIHINYGIISLIQRKICTFVTSNNLYDSYLLIEFKLCIFELSFCYKIVPYFIKCVGKKG